MRCYDAILSGKKRYYADDIHYNTVDIFWGHLSRYYKMERQISRYYASLDKIAKARYLIN